MNSLILFLLLSFISMGSVSNKCLSTNPLDITCYQNDEKTLHLNFPIEPQISSEIMELKGHEVNITMYVSTTDTAMFALFELELGDLTDIVNEDSSNFFNGMISYIVNDFGAEVEAFTPFNYQGFDGNDFNIVGPVSDENVSMKGKTLLINDRAYFWFGMSSATDSEQKVSQFLNSYSIK